MQVTIRGHITAQGYKYTCHVCKCVISGFGEYDEAERGGLVHELWHIESDKPKKGK